MIKLSVWDRLYVHTFDWFLRRIEPDCLSYKRCGGCNMRHIEYFETLNMKKKMVENIVSRNIGKDSNIKVNDVLGMGNPYNYRNKATFPFGLNENGEPCILDYSGYNI